MLFLGGWRYVFFWWMQMIWLFIGGADMFFLGGCRRSQGDGRCLGHCG